MNAKNADQRRVDDDFPLGFIGLVISGVDRPLVSDHSGISAWCLLCDL